MADPRWEAFRTGLTTPSVSALASLSAGVMLLGALSVWGVGPWMLVDGRVRWLASAPDDDYAFATAQALDLRDSPVPAERIAIAGGSGTRESVSSAEDLARRVEALVGRPVPVVDLSTDAQTTLESVAVLDGLPMGPGTVVLLGISPHRLQVTEAELQEQMAAPRFAFHSERLDAELRGLGWPVAARTGWPMVDDRNFWVLRLPRVPLNLLRGGVDRSAHRYVGLPPLTPAQIPTDWPALRARLEASAPRNTAVLERLIADLRSRGATPVLLAGPSSPGWFGHPDEDAYHRFAEAQADDLATRTGTPLWRLDRDAGLVHGDFRDPAHLASPDAQARYTSVLAGRIAELLRP